MRAIPRSIMILWALVAVAISGLAARADELAGKVLFLAAASTTDAVASARAEFVRLHPAVTIDTSFGASSALARQIEAGAEADLFLSASGEWADFLSQKQLVEKQRDLLGNELVIITPEESKLVIRQARDLLDPAVRHLALADPTSVPAGIYAKQALMRLDLWRGLASRVAGAADVRQALRFVETGAAEAGIVYATDAASSKLVRVAAKIDPQLSDPIRYPLVLVKRGAGNAAAVALYEFLGSPAGAAVFRRYGFIVLPPAPAAR